MSKKTIRNLAIIAVLIVLNGLLFFSKRRVGSASFDDTLFTISDTSSIESVNLVNSKGEVTLNRTTEGWVLDNDKKVDANFRTVLFTILQSVKVKRKVGAISQDISGTASIQFSDGTTKKINYIIDPLGTKSFFLDEENVAFQVEVPGYRDNIANIFELSKDQWRDRLVFDGSWRTIQRLKLDYGSESLQIQFKGDFFEVEGVARIDSSAVVDYLNQFQLFQANEMISKGMFNELDSLKNTKPIANLILEDIGNSTNTTFSIFPSMEGQSYHLVLNQDLDMMVFSSSRINNILKKNSDFAHR